MKKSPFQNLCLLNVLSILSLGLLVSFKNSEERKNESDKVFCDESLEIRESADKGRGVFAKRGFVKGEVIEQAPVIVIPSNEEPNKDMVLYNYTFGWGEGFKDSAIALGFGSIYNHSYKPNAYYVRREESRVIDFIALTNINSGDEITINYNGSPESKDNLWFKVVSSDENICSEEN